MTAESLSRAFAQLSTPLIADAALRLKIPFRITPPGIRPITPNRHADNLLSVAHEIWERERRQAEAIKSGRSLREQLDFARYLEKRAADPGYTFREHLRKISGAIEE